MWLQKRCVSSALRNQLSNFPNFKLSDISLQSASRSFENSCACCSFTAFRCSASWKRSPALPSGNDGAPSSLNSARAAFRQRRGVRRRMRAAFRQRLREAAFRQRSRVHRHSLFLYVRLGSHGFPTKRCLRNKLRWDSGKHLSTSDCRNDMTSDLPGIIRSLGFTSAGTRSV